MACTKGAGSRSHHVYPGQGSHRKTIPVKSFTATEECGTSTSPAEPCKANCFGICSLGGLSLHGCCLKGSQLPLRFIRMLSGELEMLLGGCSGAGVREGALRFPAAALPSPITAGDPSCPGGVRDGSRAWQRSLTPAGTIPFSVSHPGLIAQEEARGCFLRPMHAGVSQGEGCSADSGVVLHPQPVPPGPGCSRVFLTDLFLLI